MVDRTENLNLAGLLPDFERISAIPRTADQLSALFVAGLIVVATFFFLVSVYAFTKAYLRTVWIERLLKKEASETLLKNRQTLNERARKARNAAGHLWLEFDETLMEARIGSSVYLHNVFEASQFFNQSTLAGGITESRMLAAVPGFLTAMGVIGTFVGLQLGLSELNIGNDVPIKEMKEGLAHVIGGAKIAFMTSVWGVTLSVLFNFVEKLLENSARARVHRLQVRIDELFPRFSAEMQLLRIADDGSESREVLQGLAERIGQKMQESLLEATSGIQKGLEASLEKIMAPAIEKLVNETTDGSQKALEQLVTSFLDKFGEQGETQRRAMDEASKGVGEALNSMNQTLQSFVTNLDKKQLDAEERERKLIKHISGQVDELVRRSTDHGQQMANATRLQLEEIAKIVAQSKRDQDERETQLGQRFAQTVNGMGELADRQSRAAGVLIEQGKALQGQVEASQISLEKLAQSLKAGASDLLSAADLLKGYGDGVQASSQQLSGVIREATSATLNLANENQKSASAVGSIYQRLASDIEALNLVIEKLGSIVDTADSTFIHLEAHQKHYLESLQGNVKDLAEQGARLLQDYADQANAQTSEHLSIWAKHTTQYAQQMNEAARALSTVVDEIEGKLGQ